MDTYGSGGGGDGFEKVNFESVVAAALLKHPGLNAEGMGSHAMGLGSGSELDREEQRLRMLVWLTKERTRLLAENENLKHLGRKGNPLNMLSATLSPPRPGRSPGRKPVKQAQSFVD